MNRLESIKKIANNLISRFELTPPIDIEDIYLKLGVQIEEESNQYGIEAYSDLSDKLTVFINPELTYYEPRRRFTLAHELGHVCIPWHNGDIKCETDNNYININGKKLLDTQELEANIFASEILMPTGWIKEEAKKYLGEGFFSLVENVSRNANTSIMASLYALEDKLASGHIYFIRNTIKDYWMTFKSPNTFTVSWNYYEDENIEFLDIVCMHKERKVYANHEVIYYELLACPDCAFVSEQYEACNRDMALFLNAITSNTPIRSLTFIDAILKYLPEKYAVYIIYDNQIVKRICDYSSPLSAIYVGLGIENILSICKYYRFDTLHLDLGNCYQIICIKEKVFSIPECRKCDPNLLLKRIVSEICFYEDEKHMLQSINGVIASINGQYKTASRAELYNWTKYKFYMNPYYEDFCMHIDFETYIVNKIDKMISMRR